LKILQVIPAFYPSTSYGGASAVVYEISRILAERGHEVTVFTTDANDAETRHKSGFHDISGLKVYYSKNISNAMAYKHKIAISPGMIKVMKCNIKKFDIIHTHDYRTFQNLLVNYYSKKFDIPYVLQAHGTLINDFQKQKAKSVFDTFFKNILSDSSAVIALNSVEYKQYQLMGVSEEKINFLSNGINLNDFKKLPEKGIFKKKYGIPQDYRIILFLGRIHEVKGLEILIESFYLLLNESEKIILVIAGSDDGFLSTLKKRIIELKMEYNVIFTGHLNGKDKLSAYVDADVYVLPSIYETFPISIFEAAACSVPVIVTKNCSISDIIDKKIGLVVERDKKHIKDSLRLILSDERLKSDLIKNNANFLKKYDWHSVVDKLEIIYEGVIWEK
jgi:glycosyltransferase involved in cell wall biosynthesis